MVWLTLRGSPARQVPTEPVVPKLFRAARLPVTWQLCFLYAVVFGGFVSFCAYLPTYLRDIYDMDPTAAGTRTAGFALAAVIARPIGGTLSDRTGSKPVVAVSLLAVTVLALVVMMQPKTEVATGATFLAMAAALGLGAGGVFAWVGSAAPADNVGSVSGIVSAAGGLGGCFPPMVMGGDLRPGDQQLRHRVAVAGDHGGHCPGGDAVAAWPGAVRGRQRQRPGRTRLTMRQLDPMESSFLTRT